MKKFKVWLLLALVFFAGFAGGMVAARGVVRGLVRQAVAHPEMVRVRVERELNRKLDLDAKQREQVHQILQDSHQRLQELRRNFQPQVVAILQDARRQISTVLTPEQQKEFERMLAERRAFLQPR